MRASVLVLTGAGISADSGLATFRGAGGLWEGQPVEEIATPGAWALDPARVWRFYQERRAGLSSVQPNAAHHALAAFQARLEEHAIPFRLVTQNVDDLHDRASSRPLHMHGELAQLRCEACGAGLRDLDRTDPATFVPCPRCEHPRLRPDVVWFGEVPYHLPEIEAALRECTHFLAIGTSGAVYPAAGFLAAARAGGAKTWVNCLEVPQNAADADRLHLGPAVEVVPSLLDELLEGLSGRR